MGHHLSGFVFCLIAAGLVSIGQNQCSQNPPPPFNVSGTYMGTWQGTSTEDEEALACPLTIVLEHDPTAGPIADHTARGTITVDFSCVELPEQFDLPEAKTVEATFLLNDEGKLVTIVPACSPSAPVCVALGLDGTGEDTDNDGFMDSYAGNWAYRILLPGILPFGYDGTFTVQAE